ncbi:MAG: cytochrome c biogenesis protein CcsA, partial [Bacteroidales bacterium]|nr:cytochrome c biogenesis protein CcsA [Bacteroidales bacterium]
TGYLFLLIGFIAMFVMPNSRFRKLLIQLKDTREQAGRMAMISILLLLPALCKGQVSASPDNVAEAVEQSVVTVEHAARFGALPVQFRGRMMPMNTFSSEVLRKIHKEQSFGSLNSDQFLLSLFALPRMWTEVPVIAVSNEQVRMWYNLPEGYVPYAYFFDEEGHYRLLPRLQEVYHRPAGERSAAEKELINLDERVNIMYLLINQNLPGIFPHSGDPGHTWYAPGDDLSHFQEKDSLFINQTFSWYLSEVTHSLRNGDWDKPDQVLEQITAYQLENDRASLINSNKLQAEIRYNAMNIFGWSKLGYLILGALLLVVVILQLFYERPWLHYTALALTAGIVLVFIYHITGMGLRWYIAGYAPWSNSYETMVYIAWATVLAGLIFGQKSTITLALATLFGGVILFVSGLNWMDPQINTLVPVLKSPWLMFHVAVIVAAYGFFGISFLLGITNLSLMVFSKKSPLVAYRIKELSIINNLSLMVGLVLMTTGTFLGAIWANESWGRYWGWDPKETWALITVVAYTIVTHLHMVKKWNNPWIFNLLSVLAFSSVLMTFLGVNYFLSGMHSYGQTDGMAGVFTYIAVAFVLVGILGILSWRKSRGGLIKI